ncbi:MAG: hypothetical protein UW11_C0043G0003 [Parcubacteria group bacterium GW2011_GWA2_43_9b]|uniref:bAvd-like domain-containing protein n=1 Tax=Candidatus Portnoybacteria bacterium RIFCSPLOWO2_02_FULL_39_11 TaxID=1802001 RepID=A0A1G2FTT1_9BACT|nr:MAG: hypothetical protein UW11_C0043G0003 [Parcubacteria group bacterium GW2011_GWA2_43_9b]OGZ41207.1 MAG: hypothetical protein A3B04_00210 [Candidatus Portnoybacteria bacterium RIFCSPLOWO2_02_FULL_39_11]
MPRRNSRQAKKRFSKEIISSNIFKFSFLILKLWPITPPPDRFNISLVHKVCELYKNIYLLAAKIPKKDRFGIFLKIENLCLEILNLAIAATIEAKADKLPLLKRARIKIEILKRLFRVAGELKIIENKKYINIELDLQEISKMTNGWIKYLNG